MKKFFKDNATLIALFVLGLILTIVTSFDVTDGKVTFDIMNNMFFNARNLNNLTRQVTLIGIISIGMTMVILLGGIDLSVGSIVGLALIFSNNSSVPIADPFFAVLGGEYIPQTASIIIIILGLIFSFYSIYSGIQKKKSYGITVKSSSIIWNIFITIAGIALALMVFGGYRGIPIPVAIFIVLIIIGEFILRKTKLGRSIYAVGGNEDAARLSGISVFKINMFVYTTVSALSAVSGILLASRLNGAAPTLGNMFELDAIAAVVVGGTSLNGGSGTIKGTIIGTFIIGFLNNGMSMLNVDTSYQFVVKGLIIILAVWFDVMNKRKKV